MRRWLGVWVMLAASFAAPQPADAALKLCNRTSYILYAATASLAKDGSSIHGWTRIVPGDCRTAIPQKLRPGRYLVYARSALAYSGPQRAWGGRSPLCVEDSDFTLNRKGSASACPGDYYDVPFAAVDTHGRPDWTMTFDEKPRLPSLEAAQLVGVKRLLKDNGYDIAAIDAKPDRPTGIALKAFRKKMHFDDRAGNAALFAALEAQAPRHEGNPQGLTVCDDSKSDMMAAMAQMSGRNSVSRGWWRITAGGCARMISTPLKANAVWLLARKPGGTPLVSGADQFCIAAKSFEIKGRNDCSGRGFTRAGFARMTAGGQNGIVVHFDAKGLIKPYGAMPK